MNISLPFADWIYPFILIVGVPYFYLSQLPVVLKYPIGWFLVVAGLFSFLLAHATGHSPFIQQEENAENTEEIPETRLSWRTVLAKTGLISFIVCVLSYPAIVAAARLHLHFAEEQTVQAQIITMTTHRKSCDKWVLKLPNRRSIDVCQTGSTQDLSEGSLINVTVRESALAYDVRYLED